jgi:hypothetical protein
VTTTRVVGVSAKARPLEALEQALPKPWPRSYRKTPEPGSALRLLIQTDFKNGLDALQSPRLGWVVNTRFLADIEGQQSFRRLSFRKLDLETVSLVILGFARSGPPDFEPGDLLRRGLFNNLCFKQIARVLSGYCIYSDDSGRQSTAWLMRIVNDKGRLLQ